MNIFFELLTNLQNKIIFLKQDFIGFNLDISFLFIFLISSFVSLALTFLAYSFGKRISSFLIKTKLSYAYLLYIAIGYIVISSGIAIIGMLNLLTPFIFFLYLNLIAIISLFFPFSLKKNIYSLYIFLKNDLKLLQRNKFVFVWVLLFIVLAIVNLINPEVREDQYHVDFARIYLQKHSVLIPPMEGLKVSASPMLSEMYYMSGILLSSKETARYLHFVFYILILLTLLNFSKIKKYEFSIFTLILFVSAPEVIRETSSIYTDFEWIFCFLLSLLVLIDSKDNSRKYIISGIMFGGMLASKMWTIVFSFPVSIFLLLNTKNRIKNTALFMSSALLISSVWYFRSFLLTGNFLYPAFSNSQTINATSIFAALSTYIGINYLLLNPKLLLTIFSPLFFVGVILFIYNFKKNIRILFSLRFFRYLLYSLILYLLINYQFGRYLFGIYVLLIFFASIGLQRAYEKTKLTMYILSAILLLTFSYYIARSTLVIPYAIGFADKNAYLSRILVRDNSSYYDFGYKFEKYISRSDLIAMYNFHGYYYADFKYIDTNYIFIKPPHSFEDLKKKGATKLLIRSGDISWFCKENKIDDCNSSKYSFISSYLKFPFYYLYSIK